MQSFLIPKRIDYMCDGTWCFTNRSFYELRSERFLKRTP